MLVHWQFTQTRTANEENEITSISSGVAPTYDAAGNMISGPSPTNSAVRLFYVYDAWNRLSQVYQDRDNDGVLERGVGESYDILLGEYKYDGLNRRTKKTETGSRDEYYYDQNGRIVEDRYYDDGDLDYIEQYVWSQRDASSPIVCLHDGGDGDYGPPDGDVLDEYTDDWRTYYTNDANHNVTTTIRVNNANAVVGGGISHNIYTSYGEVTRCLENWTSGGNESAFDGPLYAGYWFDVDTGLYQVRARYYDPGLSRFVNTDPIGYNGGMNLYAYCGCNPINATDPSGCGGIQLDIDVPVWDFKNGRETTIRIPLGASVPQGYIPMWEVLPSSTATASQVENKSGYMYADNRTPLEREMAGYRAAMTDPDLRPDERIAAQNAFLDTQWETANVSTWKRWFIDLLRPRDSLPGVGGASLFDQVVTTVLGGASVIRGYLRSPLPQNPTVVMDQQGKHIPGHRNFQPGKSEFTYPNPQELLNEYSGKGTLRGSAESGWKETVDFGKIIGDWVDPATKTRVPTTRGTILYNSDGQAHIVPSNPNPM